MNRQTTTEVVGLRKVFIIGASGHAKVVIDIIEKAKLFELKFLVDDDRRLANTFVFGYKIIGGKQQLLEQADSLQVEECIVAIGDNRIRAGVSSWIESVGMRLSEAAIHPSVQIACGVSIGKGTVVMAGAVINSDAKIGNNCIVNTGATIDHDCVIGDSVHVAPGATLCGGVQVGKATLIGAGSVLLPNLHIGERVTIGAGTTVLCNVPDNMVVVGTPARPIRL